MKYSLQEVQNYYEQVTPAYLEFLGTTFQAGLLKGHHSFSPTESNIVIAARAQLGGAEHILDAGCGVGGPAIDFAKQYPVRVDGVTISSLQQKIGTDLVQQAGLADRVFLRTADFQALPFSDKTFDRVLFLESLGHAQKIEDALREAFRVLQPGGMLYCKDVFCFEPPLTQVQQSDLELFEKTYVYKTYSSQDMLNLLSKVGFVDITHTSLEEHVSTEHFRQAMVGDLNPYTDLPIVFGDVIGFKPSI